LVLVPGRKGRCAAEKTRNYPKTGSNEEGGKSAGDQNNTSDSQRRKAVSGLRRGGIGLVDTGNACQQIVLGRGSRSEGPITQMATEQGPEVSYFQLEADVLGSWAGERSSRKNMGKGKKNKNTAKYGHRVAQVSIVIKPSQGLKGLKGPQSTALSGKPRQNKYSGRI